MFFCAVRYRRGVVQEHFVFRTGLLPYREGCWIIPEEPVQVRGLQKVITPRAIAGQDQKRQGKLPERDEKNGQWA